MKQNYLFAVIVNINIRIGCFFRNIRISHFIELIKYLLTYFCAFLYKPVILRIFLFVKYIMLKDMSKVLAIVILALIAYNVLSSTGLIKHTGILSSLTGGAGTEPGPHVAAKGSNVEVGNHNVLPFPQISNNFAAQGTFKSEPHHAAAFSRNEVTAEDLLPREGGFTESNPSAQGTLSNRNLFEAGHHAGLNTQLNSLRNGNQQLRSDPLIPRVSVGPWSQSTYEADTNRREFEIGGI